MITWLFWIFSLNYFYLFFQFEDIFSPYSRYCSEQTDCQEYCRDQDRNNEIFKAYLAVSHINQANVEKNDVEHRSSFASAFFPVVRDPEGLQPLDPAGHLGPSHAEADQVLPPPPRYFQEDHRRSPEEKPHHHGTYARALVFWLGSNINECNWFLSILFFSQDERVDSFVSDVNSHLRQRQENERLKTIIARIDSYEPVVS